MKNTLYYTFPAKRFEQALPVGNGRLGGMVYGGQRQEKISLNDDTLWSGFPRDNNKKDAYKYLDSARQAIISKDYKSAKEIVNGNMHGHWSDSYLPFGELIIDYDKAHKKNYSRTLDIQRGICKVKADGFEQTVFASHPADMIVINIKSDAGVTFNLRIKSQLKSGAYFKDDCLVLAGKAPEVCMPPYFNEGKSIVQGDRGMSFYGVVKVIGDYTAKGEYLHIENQKNVTILVSMATSYIDFQSMPTGDAYKKAYDILNKANKDFELLKEEHIKDFTSLMDRVEFDLQGGNDDLPTDERLAQMKKTGTDYSLVALLFNFGRYLTVSASRPGSAAMNLQGIWNESVRAPWSSNYTTNINTQMNYWCTDSTNLSECFEPLFDLVKKLAVNGKVTAKDYYDCGGFVSFHNSDIWGATCPAGYPKGNGDSSSYAFWGMSAPWFLNQLYEHYLYTNDEEFKRELTALFKDCLQFYKESLMEREGKLFTCPSISPENTFRDNGKNCAITILPSMDREILHDFFLNCKELGLDAPEMEQVSVATDGRIPEWIEEFDETEKAHRHVSHLYCIYPSHRIQSNELQAAAKKSLDVRGFGGTGWSLGWKTCLWARLGNGDNAFKLIKNQLTPIVPGKLHRGGGSYPNMFDAHPPFQIDGNFGVTAGIAEMLKNQALPFEWTGSIKGLKTYGGEEISYSFSKGKKI